jgi:hypothetical protein
MEERGEQEVWAVAVHSTRTVDPGGTAGHPRAAKVATAEREAILNVLHRAEGSLGPEDVVGRVAVATAMMGLRETLAELLPFLNRLEQGSR